LLTTEPWEKYGFRRLTVVKAGPRLFDDVNYVKHGVILDAFWTAEDRATLRVSEDFAWDSGQGEVVECNDGNGRFEISLEMRRKVKAKP
jgi:hypothetical protein